MGAVITWSIVAWAFGPILVWIACVEVGRRLGERQARHHRRD